MHIASYLMATGFASLTFGQATVVVVSQIGDGQIQMPLPTVPAVVSLSSAHSPETLEVLQEPLITSERLLLFSPH
jgi:hypothetical protein